MSIFHPVRRAANLSKKISSLKLFLEISKTITNSYFELKNSSLLRIDNDFLKNFKDFKRIIKIQFKENVLEGKFNYITKNGELELITSHKKLLIYF